MELGFLFALLIVLLFGLTSLYVVKRSIKEKKA